MHNIPVWRMIKDAVNTLGGETFRYGDIKKYISEHFSNVNESTITAGIIACCVNHPSRHHYRETDDIERDFLYYEGRGVVSLYNPYKNGNLDTPIPEVKSKKHAATPARSHKRISRTDIEKPSGEAIRRYLDKYDTLDNYKAQESALNKLFREYCPNNTNLDDVLLKVVSLNTFYNTNIYNIYAVAQHIVNQNIGERLSQGNGSVVADISHGHGVIDKRKGKERKFFSFATKYCNHHNAEDYPIYDGYVEKHLLYLKNEDGFAVFSKNDLRDITKLRTILKQLQSFYRLESFSLREIDHYLWLYGKEKFARTYGRKRGADND